MNPSAKGPGANPRPQTINICFTLATSPYPSQPDNLDTDSRLAPMPSLRIVSVGKPESAFILTDIPGDRPQWHQIGRWPGPWANRGVKKEPGRTGWYCQCVGGSIVGLGDSVSGLWRASAWCGRTCGTAMTRSVEGDGRGYAMALLTGMLRNFLCSDGLSLWRVVRIPYGADSCGKSLLAVLA